MASNPRARITYKSARPNPLFLQWILELHAEAVAKDLKNQYSMKEAINSLKRYPIPLQSGAECAILKGFGQKLCAYLDNRLDAHQRLIANGKIAVPSNNSTSIVPLKSKDVPQSASTAETALVSDSLIACPKSQIGKNKKCQKKSTENCKKSYKPKYRTGSYAILIALMEHVNSSPANLSLTKEELIEKAQPFCEESFTRPKPDSHYTAWSSMTKLVNKQFVTTVRKKKALYCLTDTGYALAQALYEENKDRVIPTIDANSFGRFDQVNSILASSLSNSSQQINYQQRHYQFNNVLSTELNASNECIESEDANVSTIGKPHIIIPVISSGITEPTLQIKTTDTGYVQNKVHAKHDGIYKPIYHSGPYAILTALMDHVNSCPDKLSLTTGELIEKAQPHCKESFIKSSDCNFTTWTFLIQLVNKGLITKVRKEEEEFSLTDAGYLLAMELCEEYKDLSNTADVINVVSCGHLTSTLATSLSQQSSSQKMDSQFNSQSTVSTEVEEIGDCINRHDIVILPPGSFKVILLIDKQELNAAKRKDEYATVTQFDKYENLNREYRHLKVGDFTWVARHRTTGQEIVLPYIVERKRMDDLGMSIKDGRFHEQKFRLNKCGIPNVIYLIENFGKNIHIGLPLMSLMQSISNTRVQNGFNIHTTDSLAGTVRFLAIMTKRLTVEYKNKELKALGDTPNGEFLMTFEHFNIASAKNKTHTVQDTFIKMLLQLKGMSVEKALAINDAYNTPRVLIENYKSCNIKEGETFLAKLKYDELSRNVGPVVSKALYKLFTLEAFP